MGNDKNKIPLEGITVDGKPLTVYVKEEETKEVDKVRESDIRKAGAGVGYVAPQSKFGNTSGTRSQHYDTVKPMSDEVKMHLNYLNEMGGMVTVNDFLSKPQQQAGSIETVLNEHKEKVKFYLREQQRIQVELARHQAVCDSLQATLNILTGKIAVPGVPAASNGSGERSRRDLLTVLKTVLMDGPLTRKELREKVRILVPDIPNHSLYGMVNSGIRAGVISESGDKVELI